MDPRFREDDGVEIEKLTKNKQRLHPHGFDLKSPAAAPVMI